MDKWEVIVKNDDGMWEVYGVNYERSDAIEEARSINNGNGSVYTEAMIVLQPEAIVYMGED